MESLATGFVFLVSCSVASGGGESAARPNILWLTSEDNGPHLGAYGDRYADTPRLDALARGGMIYSNAWSNAPVCAPARTTIISGLYPTSTGAEHMRSLARLPGAMKMFPQYLREAGYYTTNNSKEDYNLEKPGRVWDESSPRAHWRARAKGQPFFAVFNFTTTHESQIRRRPHSPIHDPARVRVPAYHPDVPEVRRDWAQYHDKMSEMDREAGKILDQLKEDGLEDDTIIVYFGDHGPGMPRSKRWCYDSGLRVPLIVVVPEKWRALAPPDFRAGGRSERLVGFIDLAPTVSSLAGIRPPPHFQGRAFLGPHAGKERDHLFGFRGRMDERYDLVRSVRDRRFVYVRNYMPHKIYGQHVAYMFETPTTRVWKALHDAGRLTPAQDRFWGTKPPEELYDLKQDPDEIRDLASDPAHSETLLRLRKALRDNILETRDVGFLPEGEIDARARDSTPYEMGHDPARYPLERILEAAEFASGPGGDSPSGHPLGLDEEVERLLRLFRDGDPAVRYWGAMGLLIRGSPAVSSAEAALRAALADSSPWVRIAAAEALGTYGSLSALDLAIDGLTALATPEPEAPWTALAALNAIDALSGRLGSRKSEVAKRLEAIDVDRVPARLRIEVGLTRVIEHILGTTDPAR